MIHDVLIVRYIFLVKISSSWEGRLALSPLAESFFAVALSTKAGARRPRQEKRLPETAGAETQARESCGWPDWGADRIQVTVRC